MKVLKFLTQNNSCFDKIGQRKIFLPVYIIFLWCLPVQSLSQDLKKDMLAMVDFYKNSEALSIDIKVDVFQDKGSGPAVVRKASLSKSGSSFYYDMDESKMIVSPTSLIVIHEKEKDLLHRTISKKQYEAYLKSLIGSNLDSIIATYDSIKYTGTQNDRKHYIVYTNKGHIEKTDIYLDVATLSLVKVSYLYNESLMGQYYKVDITFKTSANLAGLNAEIFKESTYVSGSGTSLKLTAAYSKYHLIPIEHED